MLGLSDHFNFRGVVHAYLLCVEPERLYVPITKLLGVLWHFYLLVGKGWSRFRRLSEGGFC